MSNKQNQYGTTVFSYMQGWHIGIGRYEKPIYRYR